MVACVACVAAYAASVVFTGGATAVLAPAIVGGVAAYFGTTAVMNQANEDIENQEESSYWSYMWKGAKGAYTGAEIGFAAVTLAELGVGFLAEMLGGGIGGGGSAALAFAGGGTMSGALALEGEGVLAGAIQVVAEGAVGLGIVNLLEAAASGSGGNGDNDSEGELGSGDAVKPTNDGIDIIRNHLSGDMQADFNDAMIERVNHAIKNGETLTGADANFYLHEIGETELMNNGYEYATAHNMMLEKYGVTEYDLYHPDVIKAMPEWFGKAWFEYWGIK